MDWWKKKKKKEKKKQADLIADPNRERGAMLLEDIIKCCDGKSNPIKFFSADLILKATNNFSKSNRVLSEIFWDWYSGKNDDDRMILINIFTTLDSNFYRDVAISSMVSGHKNFMKLVGCCIELDKPVMVYYGEKEQYSKLRLKRIVSWKRRMKIAEDIATALAYLHTAFSTPFVYRNMDIYNILIDEDGVAKLTDFSRCISIPLGETFVKVDYKTKWETKGLKPNWFVDRDYRENGIVSEKTDTFGFGRFMLMLLIGGNKRFLKFFAENEFRDEIVDPKMLKEMGEVTVEERCSMNAFFRLAERCVGREGEVPTIVEVAKELKKIQRSSQKASSSS